jgi:type IV pilus assembly protein PilX
MKRSTFGKYHPRNQQQGIVLIIALVAIVAMTFAVYAMMRLSTSSLGVAGNISFKKNATSAADRGVEDAITFITSKSALALGADLAPRYYATWNAGAVTEFNPLTHDWSTTTAHQVIADDGYGNNIMYVIHRLCANLGSPTALTQECVRPSSLNNKGGSGVSRSGSATASGGSGSVVGTGGSGTVVGATAATPGAFYRITTRVAGPRNTLSYTQVIVY